MDDLEVKVLEALVDGPLHMAEIIDKTLYEEDRSS